MYVSNESATAFAIDTTVNSPKVFELPPKKLQFYEQCKHANMQIDWESSCSVRLGTKICGRTGVYVNLVGVQQNCTDRNRKKLHRHARADLICLTNTNIHTQVFGKKKSSGGILAPGLHGQLQGTGKITVLYSEKEIKFLINKYVL